MSNVSFNKVSKFDVQILKAISELSFRQAFENDNDPNDFEDYIQNAFSLNQLLTEIENSNSEFYFMIIPEEKSPVGYIKLNWGPAQSEDLNSSHIELERIYLLNEFRGKGYGNQLLNHATEIALKKEKEIIWLGVWEKNESAIRFYERNGFRIFGEHFFFIGKDKQRDLLLKLNL